MPLHVEFARLDIANFQSFETSATVLSALLPAAKSIFPRQLFFTLIRNQWKELLAFRINKLMQKTSTLF